MAAENFSFSRRKIGKLALAAGAVLMLGRRSLADTINWQDGGGDWFNANNWIDTTDGLNQVPGALDRVTIDNGGTAQIAAGNANSSNLMVGKSNSGFVDQTGGTNSVNVNLNLAFNLGSTGMYSLSNAGSLSVSGTEYVGFGGVGIFTQAGGTNTVGTGALIVSNKASSSGTYTLSGGTLNVPDPDDSGNSEYIGQLGIGSFDQTGGMNLLGGTLLLGGGDSFSTVGSYTLSGAGSLSVDGSEEVGNAGMGTFIQTGGANVILPGVSAIGLNNQLEVGTASAQVLGLTSTAGPSTYSLSGSGSVTVNGDEEIGFGTGSFVQTGGTNTIISGNLNVSVDDLSLGAYTLSGLGVLTVSGNENVGNANTGTFIQSGGSNTAGGLAVGNTFTGSGTYHLQGGTVNAGTATLNAGGAFTQTGGTATFGQITGTGQASITGGTTRLLPNGGTSTVGSLIVSTGGILDITNNKLGINYRAAAADPVTAIAAAITAGYNGGTWTGAGIQSSAAATNPSEFAIGYLDGNNPADTTAHTVAPNQIVIEYTLAGDAFLQNSVGFDDLVVVAQNFGLTGKDWAGGNFNYDPNGSVGFTDLVNVAQNFGQSIAVAGVQSPISLSPAWQSTPATAVVPEPAGIAAATLLAGCLLRRRSRRPA